MKSYCTLKHIVTVTPHHSALQMPNAPQLVPIKLGTLHYGEHFPFGPFEKLKVDVKVTKPYVKCMPEKLEHVKCFSKSVNPTARTWKRISLLEARFFGGIVLDGKSSDGAL